MPLWFMHLGVVGKKPWQVFTWSLHALGISCKPRAFFLGVMGMLTPTACIAVHGQTDNQDGGSQALAVGGDKTADAPTGHTEVIFPDSPPTWGPDRWLVPTPRHHLYSLIGGFLVDGIYYPNLNGPWKLNKLARSRLAGSGFDPDATQDQAGSDDDWKATKPSEQLPSAVDNSTLPCFPGVGNQGAVGSCEDFADIYYVASHNIAWRRSGQNPDKAKAKPLSPFFAFPFGNDGDCQQKDNPKAFGVAQSDALRFLEDHGAPFLSDYPYPLCLYDPSQGPPPVPAPKYYRPWPIDAKTWRGALNNRCIPIVIPLHSAHDLMVLKWWLAQGYLAAVGTHVPWKMMSIDRDPSLENQANSHAGEQICYDTGDSDHYDDANHEIALVGYDDNVWCDLNHDGKIQPEERGAFKIVNSWGKFWPKDHSGFAWISYHAVDFADNSNNETRQYTGRLTDYEDCKAISFWPQWPSDLPPTYLRQAEFTISIARRNEISVLLGISNTRKEYPTITWSPCAMRRELHDADHNYDKENNVKVANRDGLKIISGRGGPYAFDGGDKEVPATFVFTLDDLVEWMQASTERLPDHKHRFYLIVERIVGNDPVTITDFKITDGDGNDLVRAQPDKLPVTSTDNSVWISLDCPSAPENDNHNL